MIRNVILDIGDVLVHSNYEHFFKKQGYDDAMIHRLSKATFLSPVWRELDRGVWSMDEIMEAFIRHDPEIEDALRSVFRNTEGFIRKYPYAYSLMERKTGKTRSADLSFASEPLQSQGGRVHIH